MLSISERGYAAGEFPLWSLARSLFLLPIHLNKKATGQVRLSPKETYAFTRECSMFLSTVIVCVRTSLKHARAHEHCLSANDVAVLALTFACVCVCVCIYIYIYIGGESRHLMRPSL